MHDIPEGAVALVNDLAHGVADRLYQSNPNLWVSNAPLGGVQSGQVFYCVRFIVSDDAKAIYTLGLKSQVFACHICKEDIDTFNVDQYACMFHDAIQASALVKNATKAAIRARYAYDVIARLVYVNVLLYTE